MKRVQLLTPATNPGLWSGSEDWFDFWDENLLAAAPVLEPSAGVMIESNLKFEIYEYR